MPPETDATAAAPSPAAPRRRAVRTGVVISNKMDKTVVVAVERQFSHPRYDRVVRRTSKFYAHDEKRLCKPGDVVTIVESRPLSRLKRWRVRSIVREGRAILEREEVAAVETSEDIGRPARKPKAAHAGEGEAES